jgi:hypothetical protein
MPTRVGCTEIAGKHIYWNFHVGVMDDSYFDYTRQVIGIFNDPKIREKKIILLSIIFDLQGMRADMRQSVINAAQEAPKGNVDTTLAHVFINNSLIARSTLNIFNFFVRKNFPEKTFARVEEGETWLRERFGIEDLNPLFLDIRKSLPSDEYNSLTRHNYFFGPNFFR